MGRRRINQKNFYIIFVLLIFVIIPLISAIQVINFDNGLTEENLTFSGNENITRNLTINRYSNITSAFMNLSGYETPTSLETNETNNVGEALVNPPWEFCTNISLSQVSRFNITMNPDYSGVHEILPFSIFRIRDSSKVLLEELNDTDKNSNEISSNFYAPGEYGICLRDGNITASSTGYGYQTNFGGYTFEGSPGTLPYTKLQTTPSLSENLDSPYLEIGTPSGIYEWSLRGAEFQGTNAILDELNDTLTSKNLTFTGNEN